MWSEWGRGLGLAEFIGWLWKRRGSIGRSLLAGGQGRGLGGQDFLYLGGAWLKSVVFIRWLPRGAGLKWTQPIGWLPRGRGFALRGGQNLPVTPRPISGSWRGTGRSCSPNWGKTEDLGSVLFFCCTKFPSGGPKIRDLGISSPNLGVFYPKSPMGTVSALLRDAEVTRKQLTALVRDWQ